MEKRILVIDDDPVLVRLITDHLQQEGYAVQGAYSGAAGLRAAYAYQPHLIILDVMMPDMDGWTVCQRLREMCNAPILMLSALGTAGDKVRGLNLGADDYLTKPFNTAELFARVQALLRRGSDLTPELTSPTRYADNRLVIDLDKGIILKDGREVHLTPREFSLLTYMVRQPGVILAHRQLVSGALGTVFDDDSLKALKVYIGQIRKKIEDHPDKPEYILNERGRGYYFKPRQPG
jgi:DNA-binding response OmpR family regulator